jgi:uncharacterized membrane protein YagU involved in acid resistance
VRFRLKDHDHLGDKMRCAYDVRSHRGLDQPPTGEGGMSTASTIVGRPASARAIVWAGLIAGALDITAAFVVYGFFGAVPLRILQGIAGGLLGPRTYEGGMATAILGLICHFTIAFGAAAVYFALSRRMPFLVRRFVTAGVLYGIAVYFFMNRVVVPLSNARKYPFSLKMMIIGVVIHIFCVGLPISTTVKRFAVS